VPSPCPRRGLGRGFAQRSRNDLDDLIDAREHVAVQEPYDPKASLPDHLGAPIIFTDLIHVMATVKLDCKSRLGACEVRDKVSDRELSPELELAQPFRSEPPPNLLFRLSLLAAEPPRAMMWKGNRSDFSRLYGLALPVLVPARCP
jgi:hypothetical protein